MARERLACVSVDLDSLVHYCRLYGLPENELSPEARRLVYREAVGRYLDLFEETGARATFFAVGEELSDLPSAAALRAAVEKGHEIGNHSYSHDYALTRWPREEIAKDLARADEAIRSAIGVAPQGFRAPGYTLTAELYAQVCARGYLYDSSVFPAVPYWAAKAAVMSGLAALGRPSRAILDRPRVLLAPRLPYRPDPGEPYRRGAGSAVELPITVEALTRIPLIGMTVVGLPGPMRALLLGAMRGAPFLNLELHGIDLLDSKDLGNAPLGRAQRDLRIPWHLKRERLREALGRMAEGRQIVTLAEAAGRLVNQKFRYEWE